MTSEATPQLTIDDFLTLKEELDKLKQTFGSEYSSSNIFNLVSDTTWLVDIGATDHMTLFRDKFTEYNACDGNKRVLTTGGEKLLIVGIGIVQVQNLGVLKNVLHEPKFKSQLIFAQRLVKYIPLMLTLDSSQCFIFDKIVNRRIGQIEEWGGLLEVGDDVAAALTIDNREAERESFFFT